MIDRNKIITQILIVAVEYELEIIEIIFKNNVFKDSVTVIYKHGHKKFIVIYSYEKDDIDEVNRFANYFRNDLDKKLKEE